MAELETTMTSKLAWDVHHWIAGAIALVAALQFHLIFVQGFNWDEFFYLSQVHAAQNGALHLALNTIHTRLFFWLPLLPDEVMQLRVARLCMLVAELVTVASIVGLAKRFTDVTTALLAGLAYISAGYVFLHGASFRVDPIVTALLMSALYASAAIRQSWYTSLAIALLIALAGLTTIKAVFFAPAFAGVWLMLWQEGEDRKRTAVWMVTTGVLAVLLFGLIYSLHLHGLAIADTETTRRMVNNAGEKMFSMGLFPRGQIMAQQAFMAVIFSAVLLTTPIIIILQKRAWVKKFALLTLWLPILSLAIYRNSFPYFYAFILAPVAVAAAVALLPLVRRYGALPMVLLLLANAVWLHWKTPKDMQVVQANVLRTVHAMFPKPVPYIDFSSMISSFPKEGFFMSGWGMENYRDAGRPVFEDILQKEIVPLIIANHDSLLAALTGKKSVQPLLPADEQLLRDNYLHHWGPIWVAGKDIEAGDGVASVRIAVPGEYKLEGGEAVIDGVALKSGTNVFMDRGSHLVSESNAGPIKLRYVHFDAQTTANEPKPGRYGVFADF